MTLLPDAEITLGFIWQKIYQQIHIALVDNKINNNESAIAVAFPQYGDKAFPLGNQLRLLAETKEQLNKLNIQQWLHRLEDYVHIKSIKPVPDNVKQVCFVREQVKGTAGIEKKQQAKAKYWSEKSGIPIEACLLSLEKSKPNIKSILPFIWLESQETKRLNAATSRKFPLFIKRIEVNERQKGRIDCYGLSANHQEIQQLGSVPQF